MNQRRSFAPFDDPRGARSLAVVVLATLLALAAPARGVTLTLSPSSQDAYVRQNRPNQVFGSDQVNTRIRVSGSRLVTSPLVRRGLVQFDLSAIPSGSRVVSAILALHEESEVLSAPRLHGVHRILAPWREATVSWTTRPAHASAPTATASVGTGRVVRRFDVMVDVRAFVTTPTANNGWMVIDQNEAAGDDEVTYASRETPTPASHRPALIVEYEPFACRVDADCKDDNACTTNERCTRGACTVEPVTCDDGSACTDDICDPARGCIATPISCDDGFTCTVDACEPRTGCSHDPAPGACPSAVCTTAVCAADVDDPGVDPVSGCRAAPAAPGVTCSDGTACTQADHCDGAGACVPGPPVVCARLDQCHDAGSCDPATGRCSDPPSPRDTACTDGSRCTGGDRCDGAGACIPGPPVVCTRLDQCHDTGSCDPATGRCSDPPSPRNAACTDGNRCTGGDRCDGAGTCVADPVVCSAPDACHDDGTCDAATGLCVSAARPDGSRCGDPGPCAMATCSAGACETALLPDGTPCDDGNPCNGADVCTGGTCSPRPDDSQLCQRTSVVAGITNFRDASLSLIDTASRETLATVPVGVGPWGVAVRPDGREIWVTNRKARTVSVIDTLTRSVIATIPVARVPEGIVFDPDGLHAYVASYARDEVQVIDVGTRRVTGSIRVGRGPTGLVIDGDTATLYVACFGADSVTVVDTRSGRVIANVPTGKRPLHLAMDRVRDRIYVANFRSGTVSVIGTVSNTVLATLAVGRRPFGVAADGTRARAVVTNAGDDTVSLIDTAANVVTRTVAVGRGPLGVSIDAAGQAYVAQGKGATVSVLDLAAGAVSTSLAVGRIPVGAGDFIGSVAVGCPKPAAVCDDADPATVDRCDPTAGCSHAGPDTIEALGPLIAAIEQTLRSAPAGAFRPPAHAGGLLADLRTTQALVAGRTTRGRRLAAKRDLGRFIRTVRTGLRRDLLDRDVALHLLDLARRARALVARMR